MKNDKITLNVLVLFIIIYFAQGVIIQQGSIISQISLFIIIVISIKYFIKALLLNTPKSLFFNLWTTLFLSNILIYIFTAEFSNSLHFSKLKGLLIIALPFYSFYYLSYMNIVKPKHFKWMFYFILPIAIIQFNIEKNLILMQRDWTDNVVNNLAYFFVFLIPYLYFFVNNKIISFFFATILMFFIIQGSKRGAIISGFLAITIFIYSLLKNIDKKHRIKSYFTIGIIFSLMIYFAFDLVHKNEFLLSRLDSVSEGNFSGRDIIYKNIFNSWYNSNKILNILLGFGFGSALILSKTGNWAHNDWLESLAGFGLIGVVIYLLLIVSALKIPFYSKWDIDKKLMFFTIMIIWISTTFFSMNYYNATYSFFQFILLGYLVGINSKKIK